MSIRQGNNQNVADNVSADELLERNLADLFGAIGRLKSYTDDIGREGLEDAMRRDAVSHNFGLIAHAVLGLQDISGFQKYESILDRWLKFSWEFTWKSPEVIEWDMVWEILQGDLPLLEVELARIAAADCQ